MTVNDRGLNDRMTMIYHYPISQNRGKVKSSKGKTIASSDDFLYLCTGNRKNSLLVPKVGHL